MKILFISTNDWIPWGGSEVLWSETACYLSKTTNNAIHVYAKRWETLPKHYTKLKENGCQLVYRDNQIEIKKLSKNKALINRLLPSRHQFKEERKDIWFSYINELKPDLMILSLGDHNEGLIWTEIARKQGIKYAIIVQLAKESNIPLGFAWEQVTNQYLNAKKVYFVSEQNMKILQIQCANDLNNSEIVVNPFPKNQELIDFPDKIDPINIAFVASLSSNHKGHDILFQVLNNVKWRERPIRLNLYGSGLHENYLKALKDYLKLDMVNFCGFETNNEKIYTDNHATILPSRMEGMSLALLEAMSNGRIVITTNVGGASEIIDDNINGFIAQFASIEFLDDAMERAWEKRNEWNEMGKLAAKKIQTIFAKDPIQDFANRIVNLVK